MESTYKMLPKSMKRKAVGVAADLLKMLLREAHKGEALEPGEEDFGLVMFQTDKHNPRSELKAVVCSLDDAGTVHRMIKMYSVDDLIPQLQEKI